MADHEPNIWRIHAGRAGEADSLFLKKNCVAIGWAKMGDLSAIKADRETYKTRLTEVYPEKKPGVAKEIEETTRDFILKQLAQELKGHPLAEFGAHLLGTMGYRCRLSPEGPDRGVDIVAHKDELGFEPPIIKVQVKNSEGSIGDPVVSALYGKVAASEFGLLVTLGTYTN